MPRKKSVKEAARHFREQADAITAFLATPGRNQSKEHASWLHEYGVIRLYREFERLILGALVGAINNDTSTLSRSVGIQFPAHLTDEVCEFIVIGDGFFDFKGRDGLIQKLRKYIPENHCLVSAMKSPKYKTPLEQLSALRNLAAHDSTVARSRAKDAVGQKRMGSAGSWLKAKGRLASLARQLKELATEIENAAPY